MRGRPCQGGGIGTRDSRGGSSCMRGGAGLACTERVGGGDGGRL